MSVREREAHADLFGTYEAVRAVLRPDSVVVIGASEKETTMAGAPIRNLLRHGYGGKLFAINPNRTEVAGVRSYAHVADLPEAPDTAVLVVAADLVPTTLRQCAERGIRTATVVASGFGEGAAGEAGETRDRELAEVLRATGIRIVGPNTAGLMNISDSYVPRAAMNHPPELRIGNVAVITQSGALCNTVSNRAQAHGLGLNYIAATGDQLDLDLWDMAAFALEDIRTRCVLMVIEGFKSPDKFLQVAARARELGKPIVALKIGVSELGSRVVATHSGALAGVSDVQAAVLREQGVVTVQEIDDLWELGLLMQKWGVPSKRTSRVGLLALSGGEAAFGADNASILQLDLPRLSARTADGLSKLSPLAKPANPFDTAGEVMSRPSLVGEAIDVMLKEPAFDCLVVASPVFAGIYSERIFGAIVDTLEKQPSRRTAISAWTAGELTAAGENILKNSGLAVFQGVHRALRAIRNYDRYSEALEIAAPSTEILQNPVPRQNRKSTVLSYWQAREQLGAIGVPFNSAEAVATIDQAVAAAERIGYPVSLKLSSRKVVHKVRKGAVFLLLSSADEVRTAAARLLDLGLDAAAGDAIIVEKYVGSYYSLLVGGSRDAEFGPILLFGLGGGYAEAYADIARATCPIGRDRAAAMVSSTTIGRVIGQQGKTLDSLMRLLPDLSNWFSGSPNVESFDINPILVAPDGSLCAVDARIQSDEE